MAEQLMNALDDLDPELNLLPDVNSKTFSYSHFPLDDSYSHRFSLFHSNVRSLSKNYDELTNCLNLAEVQFSIVALTETWLVNSNKDLYPLTGYNSLHAVRNDRRGGGVALFARQDLMLKHRPDLDTFTPDLESVFAEITLPNSSNFVVGVLYRPPNGNHEYFLGALQNTLNIIQRQRKKCYILGDFNIDMLPTSVNAMMTDFLDVMHAHTFIALIDCVTRVDGHSSTLLDQIFTNDLSASHESAVIVADISDHYPVLCVSDIICNKRAATRFCTRNFSDVNKARFIDLIHSQNWDVVLADSDAQSAYDALLSSVLRHYDTAFPVTEKTRLNRESNPWITTELKRTIKLKNSLYRRYKRRPTVFNEISYKNTRNRLRRDIAIAKRVYYQGLIEQNQNHMKKLWQVLRELTGVKSRASSSTTGEFVVDGEPTRNKKLIADSFNEYFVDVGPSLAAKVPQSNSTPEHYLHGNYSQSIFLAPVTQTEVMNCVMKLKSSSAPGQDSLKSEIVKTVAPELAAPLAHVINLCFETGIVPQQMKMGLVTPVHKGGDPSQFRNYRPISVLPVFSKVFERILHDRLYDFFQEGHILSDSQFGFRKGYSTDMALAVVVDLITGALDLGKNVIGVFLDLSKAFDTVDFGILLRKLEFYGVRGNAIRILRNYLYGRWQAVSFDGIRSDFLQVECGVPQGSIMGPLLFLIYINDLDKALTVARLALYADDTNIFLSGYELQDMEMTFNAELARLHDWFKTNRLSLNTSKTHAMLFTLNSSLQSITLNLKIDSTAINTTTQCKFLGIYFDHKLTWASHIQHICNKISRSIGILNKVKNTLDTATLLLLYNSLVLPYLTYGNVIWGRAASSHLSRLLVLQKRAIRIVHHTTYLAHTAPLFHHSRLLKISDLNIYLSSIFVYKIFHNIAPSSFASHFPISPPVHGHHTRSIASNTSSVPFSRTSLRQKTLAVILPKLYNDFFIQNDIIFLPSMYSFKTAFKSHLLAQQ